MAKKFLGTIGKNETKHFYEADVIRHGEVCEVEIQADDAVEARGTANAAGYELIPLTLKFVC